MTFYEELGVPPDAPIETIRDAYRNVARLLHPDVQTDPVLRESAEMQMKRLNHLYSILSNPERRRRYDLESAKPSGSTGAIFLPAPSMERAFRPASGGTVVWLAATTLCAVFIVWLAARESSSSPAVYPLPSAADQTAGAWVASESPPASPGRTRSRMAPGALSATPSPVKAPSDTAHGDELASLRGQLLAANTARDRLAKEMAAKDAARKSANSLNPAPAPIVIPQALPEVTLPVVMPPTAPPPSVVQEADAPRDRISSNQSAGARWTGSWAYRHTAAKNENGTMFPPEFIEAVIREDHGRIRGQYHARFKVAGANIPPDVDFHFEGEVTGSAARIPWTGRGGAKGEVRLRLVSGAALEVIWEATQLGKSMGLASGTAVLDKKN